MFHYFSEKSEIIILNNNIGNLNNWTGRPPNNFIN